MNALWQFLRSRRIVVPIRLYHALSTLLTLGATCLLSSALVCALYHAVKLPQSLPLALGLCSASTLLLGGLALAWGAGRYIRPARDVAEATGRVAAGDFSVRIPLPDWHIGIAEAYSLVEHFNRMTHKLESMEQMQKDFTANVSHEFKTPLSSIIGFAEILMDGNVDAKDQREYLALIHREAQRLSRLSENILRLSRLDAQTTVMRHEPVAVDEQIRRCLILLTEKFADKKAVLDIQLGTMTIANDPDLLEQLWLNLVENALKYSPEGKTLHIFGKMTTDVIVVSVRDEGVGIPPEKQPHIWNRFYQCEESHREHGHGLGLSIVRCVVDMLGGTIECHSTIGQGTEMRVTLPGNFSPPPPQRSY